MFSFDTVILFSFYFYVWKIRQSILVYKDAAGMWGIDRFKPYVEIGVNLFVNIVLVQLIGINGILISTIVSMLFVSIPWETKVFINRFYKPGILKYLLLIFRYLLFSLIAGALTYWVCSKIRIDNMLELPVKLFICILVPNLIVLVLGLKNDTHHKVVALAVNMIKTYLPMKG